MSYDVFKFVALRPPEATKIKNKKNTITLASVSSSEAFTIYSQLNRVEKQQAEFKALVTEIGAEKALSALMISGVDAALINKVIAVSELDSDDVVVLNNETTNTEPSNVNPVVNSLQPNTVLSATLNPNLARFFRNNRFDGIRLNDTNALNEGNSDTALNEGNDDSVLNEGPNINVLDEGIGSVLDEGPTLPDLDNVFNEGPGIDDRINEEDIDTTASFFRPVGVGDLQIVQQELHRYELGEIAYVENVLASEYRERSHKQTNEQEVTLFEEEETEHYMETNLQSSERFELQLASKEEIEKRAKNELSMNVSGSYGPTVEVKAGMQFSIENAKRSSNERSSQFAQEVTESAVQRTQSRVKESRNEIQRSRTEQSNIHRFDNTQSSEHIAGVYRYVDKIYKMRLVNRGVRFFYEFYIPSPGAYLRQLSDNQRKKPAANFPKEPVLRIADITPKNYQRYVEEWGVRNAPVPPEPKGETMTEVASDADSGSNGAQKVRKEGSLLIERDYEITSVKVSVTAFKQHSTDPEVWVTIGSETQQKSGGWPKLTGSDDATVFEFETARGQRGTLGFSLYARHDATVQLLIQVDTKPTERAMTEWKHKVYDAIFEAYQAQLSAAKAEYAETLANQSIGDLVDAPPDRLRELERDELKRLCLQLMGGEAKLAEERVTNESSWDTPLVVESKEGPMLEGNLPISRKRLDPLAVEVRFAEQAFEWSNMSFTLYPYYWNEPDQWAKLVALKHADPLHANFLRSGIARVLVPVRLNFEDSVRDFVYRGRPALYSTEPANITDDRWLPLHQEMREATQRRQKGDIEVDTWLTRMSTPLVMLDTNVQVDEHGHMMQRKNDDESEEDND
ncbi:hypothetical protein [Alteromonas sp. BMJM2]|uniref:hypothetical protein n=1 Tax=Alteromonas sp. BMJM2 TaxID=2954241 RepID=UPI0022B4B777|nr:hypothetical protein [Alteromonas sp. BMJM2]